MSDTSMDRKCYESVIRENPAPMSDSMAPEQDDQADMGATRRIVVSGPAAQRLW